MRAAVQHGIQLISSLANCNRSANVHLHYASGFVRRRTRLNLLAALGIVLFILVAKAQILAAATSAARGKLGLFINEEDSRWLKGKTVDVDDPRVHRIHRAHRNDLEALLPFAIVSALYVASGGPANAGIAYFAIFLFARLLHTFAYLGQRASLRRLAFTISWVINFVIGGHAIFELVIRG